MATVIITNPAVSLFTSDPTPADTITITDGPTENGFQTTQVAEAATTIIFANQAAVTIDGGNHNDAVVLDNPDPAAGLLSLTVQNLGGAGAINGGNPNANSPDIAVATLSLTATSIGNIRALRTQVSTLSAVAGNLGNINIANGVAAPVTLNVANLTAVLGAGGPITLTNNGTINDTTTGISAIGSVNITASGAAADLNTGSGAGIISNQGGVNLMVGRDINLGDGVGSGNVGAVAGITMSAGGNINLNANALVSNGTSGNILLTAGGNITMLTSPGSIANDPEIVNFAPGGSISLSTGSGHTLTLDSTNATTAVQSSGGTIQLAADAMVINKGVNAASARVVLTPATAGQAIRLGGANAPGVLGLTQAELNQLTAGVVQIGGVAAGNITIASPISNLAHSNVLTLIDNGAISQGAFGSLAIPAIRITSTGPVTLNNPNNNIGAFAADVTGAVTINDGANVLGVGTVDGDVGIVTTNSAINLTADNMTIAQQVNAGTGIVTLAPFTASQTVALGGPDAAGTLGLTDTELSQVTASVLRVDANAGNIDVIGGIGRQAGYNTLSLATGGGIFQTAALSVANLALNAGGIITLTNSNNIVDTLAFTAGSAVSFTNFASSALTIGAVDGIAQSTSGGITTISTGGNLTFATGLTSGGGTTLTSTSGAILDGDNGADVDVTAPSLALSASTGIGTAAHPLQTQVGFLNALTGTGGVFINNGAAAPATLNIGTFGGGVRVNGASGDIVLTNNGTIDSFNNNDIIRGPGNVTVKALGGGADLNVGSQASSFSVFGAGSGLVDVEAGRDINLGNSAGFGAMKASTGAIKLVAGRNLTIDANAYVQVAGGGGGITATAGGNITMATAPGSLPNSPAFFTAGGAIALATGASGTLTLASTGTDAILSSNGNIALTADAMSISQGVNAGAGNVLLQQVTAGEQIRLGTLIGGLQLSNAALNQVTAKTLTIGNATAGSVSVAGTVAPANVTNLTINSGGNFTAIAATVNIGAGVLTIGFDENNHGATADLSGAAITAGTVVVDSGAGNDTIITGAGAEIINGGGGTDTAVFSGTLAQYAINTAGGVTTVTKGGVTDTLTGIKFLSFSDQTVSPTPAPSTPGGTTADLILRETTGVGAGQLDVFDLGNNSILAGYAMGSVGLNWQTLGLGSFAGNPNEADMLMRDSNTGNIEFFDIASSQIVGAGLLGTLGAAWQPLGFGDFSGNANETDMLMRNINNGSIYYFDIQHNQIVSAGSVGGIGVNWQVLGTGDFSGNPGEADMIMRDVNTGAIDFFDIQHNQIVGAGAMGGIGVNWQVLGAGDFSGNANETDLLLRDVNTGTIDYFDIQHNQFVSAGVVGGIGVNWQVLGFGDVSGAPGESDMIMRDVNTGAIDYFDIQHNQIVSAGALGGVGTEWQHLGVGSPLVLGSPLA